LTVNKVSETEGAPGWFTGAGRAELSLIVGSGMSDRLGVSAKGCSGLLVFRHKHQECLGVKVRPARMQAQDGQLTHRSNE
jgi:hypothetical protein